MGDNHIYEAMKLQYFESSTSTMTEAVSIAVQMIVDERLVYKLLLQVQLFPSFRKYIYQ